MGTLITIGDHNWTAYAQAPSGHEKGLVPRDLAVHPPGFLEASGVSEPFSLPLIDEAEWPERIADQEARKSSLQHIRDTCGPGNGQMPSLDQDGYGYCWNHSTTSSVMLLRGKQMQPYVLLSAFAVGCMVKNYRNEGGYGGESLDFSVKTGIPSAEFWPIKSTSRSNDNPNTWANAALHKVVKWWECSSNPNTRRQQVATALLLGLPVIADFNWWGHSVCLIRLMSKTITRLINSWSDSWSDHGVGDLEGGKAWPDDAWVPCVPTSSLV